MIRKLLFLFVCVVTSVTAWGQSVVKIVSEDGKTLTLTCTGNVANMPDAQGPTGNKVFTAAAHNGNDYGKIYKTSDVDNDGNLVTIGDICSTNTDFYRKVYTWNENVTIPTEERIGLTQSLYLYNGTDTYAFQTAGTQYVSTGAYYTLGNAGTVASADDIVLGGEAFAASCEGWIYRYDNVPGKQLYELAGTVAAVHAGDAFNGTAYVYFKAAQQNNGNIYSNAGVMDEAALEAAGYLINAISSESTLFTIENGDYIKAAGKAYNASSTYYKGVKFSAVEDMTSKVETKTYVNIGSDEYYKKVDRGDGVYVYPQVVDGEEYVATTNYCTKNGATAELITRDNYAADGNWTTAYLAEMGFIEDQMGTFGYWAAMAKEISANGYENVIFTTAGSTATSKTYADINYVVTQNLLAATTMKSLDLSGVQIDELHSFNDVDDNNVQLGSFVQANKHYTNLFDAPLEKLALPHIKNGVSVNGTSHYHVPAYLLGNDGNQSSHHVSSIVMPDNATCVQANAFSGKLLNEITLNEGLKMVGANAFDGMHTKVLVIPASVEYIGKGSFGQGYVTDVYFSGTEAPIVEMDAFGSKAYVCNNAHINPGSALDPIIVEEGSNPGFLASRDNYYSGDYAAALLHLRTDLTAAQRAKFTDVTRDYHVFDTYRKAITTGDNKDDERVIVYDHLGGGFVQQLWGDGHDNEYAAVSDGQTITGWTPWVNRTETETGTQSQDVIVRTFWNGTVGDITTSLSSKGGFNTSTTNSFYSGQPGAELGGGQSSYYDRYVGTAYHWPCQSAYDRSYTVATNNLLWNGTSTIAEGITAKGGTYTAKSYDINCDGDTDDEGETAWANGSEYIGIHQFVLVTNDIAGGTTTEEWEFEFGGANWWTICVPVSMTVKEVRETFGVQTQVCKFSNVTRDSNDKIKFYFTDEQCYGMTDETAIAIQANEAYMIRPSYAEGTTDYKFTLPNYTLDDHQVPVATTITVNDLTRTEESYTYTFIGQYNTQADGSKICMPQYSYYLGKVAGTSPEYHKLFIQTGETGKWKPFTCVILASDGANDYATFFDPNRSQSKDVSYAFGDENYDKEAATSIKDFEVVCGSQNTTIYNLNGQAVDSRNLKKGIYVKSGRTFIVK